MKLWPWVVAGGGLGLALLLWSKKAQANGDVAPAVSTRSTFVWTFSKPESDVPMLAEKFRTNITELQAAAAACLPGGRFVGWSSRNTEPGRVDVDMLFEHDGSLSQEAATTAQQCIDKWL